jgi:hypothetical protein
MKFFLTVKLFYRGKIHILQIKEINVYFHGKMHVKERLGYFLSKGFTEVKEEDKRYFTKDGKLEKKIKGILPKMVNWKKHNTVNVFHNETVNWKNKDTVNVFHSEMVTMNVFYSEMVNWANKTWF